MGSSYTGRMGPDGGSPFCGTLTIVTVSVPSFVPCAIRLESEAIATAEMPSLKYGPTSMWLTIASCLSWFTYCGYGRSRKS